MIFITKTTQILEVLYPVIPHDQIETITTKVLPKINELVDMVDVPSYSIQCTSSPLAEKIEK